MAAPDKIASLRRFIQQTAPFVGDREGLSCGWAGLDARLGGGLPRGALSVVTGAQGGGRRRLAVMALAAASRRGRPVAWVDGAGDVYPPGLAGAGVELSRLLWVRGVGAQGSYALEQLAELGVFELLVGSGLGSLPPHRARRLQGAAERGRSTTLLILDPPAAAQLSQASLRMSVRRRGPGLAVSVDKDRRGRGLGASLWLPLDPAAPTSPAEGADQL